MDQIAVLFVKDLITKAKAKDLRTHQNVLRLNTYATALFLYRNYLNRYSLKTVTCRKFAKGKARICVVIKDLVVKSTGGGGS